MDNQIQCKHCTRTFKSRMALGGHMRVHKEKLSRIEPNISKPSNNKKHYRHSMVSSPIENLSDAAKVLMMMVQVEEYYHPLQVILPLHVAAPAHEPARRYICGDCNMSFNSHYALGGHRSKHSRRRLLALPPPNQGLRRSPRLFGVDLNQPYHGPDE